MSRPRPGILRVFKDEEEGTFVPPLRVEGTISFSGGSFCQSPSRSGVSSTFSGRSEDDRTGRVDYVVCTHFGKPRRSGFSRRCRFWCTPSLFGSCGIGLMSSTRLCTDKDDSWWFRPRPNSTSSIDSIIHSCFFFDILSVTSLLRLP